MYNSIVEKSYNHARQRFAEIGVDIEKALTLLAKISISLQCWQGDDVAGFENPDSSLTGSGIQVTGNYIGKARNISELQNDVEKVLSLLPGNHRLNLHAMYGEFGNTFVDRDQIEPTHFKGWVDWAKDQDIKLDFNATCFSHPKASSGFTLSSKRNEIQQFWIEHVKRCREISAFFGKELGTCIHNLWIPDGSKDIPVDRWSHRKILKDSLDEIFTTEYSDDVMKDALESKLFGIGSESYVVGSHEFYLGYVLTRKKMICLDMGHFHPTESIADKISAILQFTDQLLLHMSRGVRWDSDHVIILNDDIKSVCEELVRSKSLKNIYIAMDFFDASINRIGAWVIGARAVLKGFLWALLLPQTKLEQLENEGKYFERLALLEEVKTMPVGAVWDYYCLKNDVPNDHWFVNEIQKYEQTVLSNRV